MKISRDLIQLTLYFFVGAGATIVEWSVFYVFDVVVGFHYVAATAIAFAVSTLANWCLGRLMVFKKGDVRGLLHELLAIYSISVFGLLANIAIMYVIIEWMKAQDMTAKIIATAIVFAGNFLVRKFWIYKV